MKDIYTFYSVTIVLDADRLFITPNYLNRLIRRTLGFETSTYFIRSFGKRYSVTPLQYRKSNKESSL